MVYQWRKGYGVPVSAELAGKEFERITKANGSLTAQALVDESRPEDAPMHRCFEWDNDKAAEKYRISQASRIICSLVVEQETKSEPIVTRAYVDVSPDYKDVKKPGVFVSIDTALRNEEMRSVVFQKAIEEMRIFKAKYRGLKELAAVFAEMDKVDR